MTSRKQYGDNTRSQHMPYHFFLSTRDMARFGYLMLQNGRWCGDQLIPSHWVQQMITPVTASSHTHPASAAAHHLGYGYLWWILEDPPASPLAGTYMAWGMRGQYILVIPKHHTVIAHKSTIAVAG